jgi:hypothetical protein
VTPRAPDWTREEFAILLSSPSLSPPDLAADFPGRSSGAIEVVRQGIHLYHRGQPTHDILSRMMLAYLEPRRSTLEALCAACILGS